MNRLKTTETTILGPVYGASRRVAQLEGAIRKARKGREVLISLH